MIGFELQISGVRNNCYTNCTTTTDLLYSAVDSLTEIKVLGIVQILKNPK